MADREALNRVRETGLRLKLCWGYVEGDCLDGKSWIMWQSSLSTPWSDSIQHYKIWHSGAPGWLSGLSVQLLISAQVMIPGLWDWAPCWALHWAWSLLKVPPTLSLCPSPTRLNASARALYLSLKKKKKDKIRHSASFLYKILVPESHLWSILLWIFLPGKVSLCH